MRTIYQALFLSVMTAASAYPAMLSLGASAPQVGVGQTTEIELLVSGLGDGVAPSLGAWIIDITYDSAVFSIGDTDVTFGTSLGDPDLDTFASVDASTAGIVLLDQTSFLLPADLVALQSSSFTLATLRFTGLAPGTGVFGFSFTDLADENVPSNAIALDGTLGTTMAVVSSEIPEPATVTLLGLSLLGMAVVRRKRR